MDFLGPSVNFTIRNDSNFKTIFGGILSFLKISLYILTFYFFSFDFINKENPNVLVQNVYEHIPNEITNDNFLLSYDTKKYNIEQQNLISTDLSVTAYFIFCKTFGICTKRKIKTDKCGNLFNNSEYYNQLYDQRIFTNLDEECLYLPKNDSYHLNPNVFKNHTYIETEISLRVNQNTCDLMRKIKLGNFTDNTRLSNIITVASSKFNPKNLSYPFYGSALFLPGLDLKNRVDSEVELNYNILYDDCGIFLPNEKIIKRFTYPDKINKNIYDFEFNKFEKVCNQSSSAGKSSNNPSETSDIAVRLFTLKIKPNYNYYIEYNRTYKKLQDVLGNVNGMMELLNLILYFIISLYSNYRLDFLLVNENLNIITQLKNNKNFQVISENYNNCFVKSNNMKQIDEIIRINKEKDLNKKENSDSKVLNFDISEKFIKEKTTLYSNRISMNQEIIDIDMNKSNIDIKENNKKEKFKLKTNEILYKLEKLNEPRMRYLDPSILDYYLNLEIFNCFKKKKSKNSRLLTKFSQKINKKIDIFYYFKVIKKIKLLQKFYFTNKEHRYFFKILAKDFYSYISIDFENENFFNKKKQKKLEFIKNYYLLNENLEDKLMYEIFPSKL